MLVNFSNVQNIFMVCGHTDMRCGIDGLASIITDKYNLNLKHILHAVLAEMSKHAR